MQRLRHIWFIALKDLKLFITDRLALFFAILFPFLFIMLFNFLNLGGDVEDPRLELHLVSREAAGGLSYQIIDSMETSDESRLEPGDPRIIWDKDYDKARQAVEDEELTGFLAFPADFTEGIMMGYGTNLEVVTSADDVNTRAALNGMAQAIASQISAKYVVAEAIVQLMAEEGLVDPGSLADIDAVIQSLFSDQGGVVAGESIVTFVKEKVGELEAENPSDYVVPGYLVMFIFFTAAISAVRVVRERQNHTLERMLASSVRGGSIVGGIYLGTTIKGLIQMAIFWAAGVLIFNVDLGLSPVAVVTLSVLMVVMSASFSIMLATLVKTERSADSISVFTSLVLAPLGGCWWPLFLLPRWMQALAKMTPHGWAVTGFNKLMLYGADFGDVIPEMMALVAFAVVFGIIAVLRFRTSAVE